MAALRRHLIGVTPKYGKFWQNRGTTLPLALAQHQRDTLLFFIDSDRRVNMEAQITTPPRCPHRRAMALAGLAVWAAGCSHGLRFDAPTPPSASPPPPALLAPAELQAVRAQIHAFATTHCGTCHKASLPTAKPAALAIYNLDAENWSSTLTAAQLEGGFTRRLNGRLDERGRLLLRTFVSNEAALRKK
jgi:hypothetical protein